MNVCVHLVEDGGDVVATLNATVIKHPWLSALWCYATLETAFYVFVFLPRRKETQKVRKLDLGLHYNHLIVIHFSQAPCASA